MPATRHTPTDVDEVLIRTTGIAVYIDGRKHFINRGDEVTFLGDTHPEIFTSGERYRYIGRTSDEPTDAVSFENTDTGARVKVYRTDLMDYFLASCFKIHGA